MTPTFSGELMLAGWGETHNGGAKLTFWLPDAGDLDVFRGLTVRKGNTAGQRFMAVLVEVDDQEQPKPSAETDAAVMEKAKDAVKGGELAKLAGILCSDPEFRMWFADRGWTKCQSDPLGQRVDEESITAALRYRCGVTSRAELDHNPDAAQKFHVIRKAWVSSGVTR